MRATRCLYPFIHLPNHPMEKKVTSFTFERLLSLFPGRWAGLLEPNASPSVATRNPNRENWLSRRGTSSPSSTRPRWGHVLARGERCDRSSPQLIKSRASSSSSAEEGPLPRQAQRHGGRRARKRRRRAGETGSARGPQSQPHAVCVPPSHTHIRTSLSAFTQLESSVTVTWRNISV